MDSLAHATAGIRDRLFLEEAVAIADQLGERGLTAADGRVTWHGPSGYGTAANPLRVSKLGPHLYDGTAGVALFLAAVALCTGDADYRELSLRAILPLRRGLAAFVADRERANRRDTSIGGLMGIGSFIYGLLKIGEWLGVPALVQEAREATVLITPERIANDRRTRIQTGSAGAVLALLALHRRDPSANREGRTPLEVARDCARHLLETRVAYDRRPRAWPLAPGKPPLASFCYGAAGIAYALLRLYEVDPEPAFREAADEGLAFVRSLYSPAHRGWQDIRSLFQSKFRDPADRTWKDWWASGSPEVLNLLEDRAGGGGERAEESSAVPENRFLSMWCHGSSGFALGRLGALHLMDSPEIREEIGVALEPARSLARGKGFDRSDLDDLCCGHMGRIEALLYAAERLGDESLLEAARELAHRVVLRALEKGRYGLSAARGTDEFCPTLFQGCAGVGYTLLRLARPRDLPSLLLFE